MSRSVDFFGEQIALVDEPSDWAMLEFAEASTSDANELAGLAAIMRLLESAIAPDDWQRFRGLARKNNARIERDLMPIVVELFTGATDRPTQRPSDSSDGPAPTPPSSTDDSSSLAARLQSRPDLMVIVQDAQSARLTG